MEGRRLGSMDGGESMPWLEPVEVADEPVPAPGAGRIILLVIAALLMLGAIIGGWYWFAGTNQAAGGNGELIPAPAGDYKVPAPEPGGMEVEGEGDSAFPTSEGEVPRASLDMSAIPEAPIIEPKAKGKVAGGAHQPSEASSSNATLIQLGAFSSEKAATGAWKALAKRFTYLEPLAFSVVPVEQGERTLYRLRASGAGAGAICGRLRIAGEACVALN